MKCAPHLEDLRDGEVGQPDPGPGGDDAGEQHRHRAQVGPGVLGLAPAGYSGVGGGVGELAGAEGGARAPDRGEAECEGRHQGSASKSCIRRFVITEKAPTRAFSWLKAATTAFTFKT